MTGIVDERRRAREQQAADIDNLSLVDVLTHMARARQLYAEYTDNHPTTHSNRFPMWAELLDNEKLAWIARAKAESKGTFKPYWLVEERGNDAQDAPPTTVGGYTAGALADAEHREGQNTLEITQRAYDPPYIGAWVQFVDHEGRVRVAVVEDVSPPTYGVLQPVLIVEPWKRVERYHDIKHRSQANNVAPYWQWPLKP